jgi:hypothetical protein
MSDHIELRYGRGLAVDPPEVTLREANLLPDMDYAEALLVLADHAVRGESALDRLLFALCWARFDLTVTGKAARQTVHLHMDRSDVSAELMEALGTILGRANERLIYDVMGQFQEDVFIRPWESTPGETGVS